MQDDDRLIQRIYDAAMAPSIMPDVLQDISDRTGAYGAMIFDCTHDAGLRRVGLQHLSSVYDAASILDYAEAHNDDEIADQDRFADLSGSGNDITLIHDKALYSGNYRPGQNVDAMLRRGVSDRFGALLSKEAWNIDRFAFQTLKGAPLPSAEKLQWAERMLAHLAKSMSIGRSMSQQNTLGLALTQFLDALPIGVGIMDPSGKLLFSSRELDRIAQDNPLVRISAAKHLTINASEQQGRLDTLLSSETEHGRFGARPRREALYLPAADDMGLFIEICPISEHPELSRFATGTRLVSVFDGSASHRIEPDTVARFFPLSKSEVTVLGLVSEGYSNNQIAEMRARSVETVNSQLKSLLRKTSARNRTELVRVAMGLSMFSAA